MTVEIHCLFCLFPSLLLGLFLLARHSSRAHHWMTLTVKAAAWRIWVFVCMILELPLDRGTKTRTRQAGSSGADFSQEDRHTSDGPQLICKPTALAKYLLRHCSSLAKQRLASWPRGDPHLQTLSSLLYWQDAYMLQFTRDHLLLKDGGVVALDWAVGTRPCEGVGRKKYEGRKELQLGAKALGCFTSTPPVLLLIPQAWGGMTPHLTALCSLALHQGFYVVVFLPRGTEGCPMTSVRLTEFGDPADLEQAVAYVHSRHPSSKLVVVSEGSGSGALLSYLGECGSATHLTAAAALSPVLLGQEWFETGLPPIYRWGALFRRKLQLSRYASSFREVLDVDHALSCSSLKHFEEALFCSTAQKPPEPQAQKAPRAPVGSLNPGLSSRSLSTQGLAPSVAWALGERAYPATDWESYWERNEPLRDADEVAVPVLCICSRDDPLLPPDSTLPLPLFQRNPYFFLVLTDSGGHCGFTLEGQDEGGGRGNEEAQEENWSHMAVLEYFRVVAEFLRGEERGGPTGGDPGQAGLRGRGSNLAAHHRRRGVITRRSKPQTDQGGCGGAEEGSFTWRRCYTR